MVSYCCVKGCSSNNSRKKKDPNALISFHAFPCNQELKAKWLKAIGRPNWVPPSHARVCSVHFNNDQMNYEGFRIRMKDDAVPIKSLPVNSNFEASEVEACRLCLATELRLYSLQESQLNTCIESIVGINENNIEGLPQYVCYQCAAHLMKCYRLVEKSMIAQATLLDIFARHGQITKSLIKQQNREKLNLNSIFTLHSTTNYFNYKFDDSESLSHATSDDNIDISYKNDAHQLQSDIETRIHDEIEMHEMQFLDVKVNEEINKCEDNVLDMCIDSPILDSESDINETKEEIVKSSSLQTKKVKPDKPVRKKVCQKENDPKPVETDMRKYFNVVKLSAQIEEWKKAVRRPLTSETVYECDVCSKVFAHINSYRCHIACHNPDRGKVECPVCKLRYKTEVLVKSHVNRAHAKKLHCRACPKVFNNVAVARKHQRWHAGYRYACAWCPFASAHASALGVHVRRAHAHTHTCALCGRSCVSARGLALHTSIAHRNFKDTRVTGAYRCEACDINFVSEGARRVHLMTSSQHKNKTNLPEATIESDELRNTCSRCGVQYPSFRELVAHARAKHPRSQRTRVREQHSYPTRCELCNETVSSRRKHWQHFRKHHPKDVDSYRAVVTAVCDTCGKGFQNSAKLRLHKLRHAPPTVRCELCPRVFYDKYALARHSSTHGPGKPYQCRTCGKAFKMRNNLHRHARVHTDVAAYDCSLCGKKFKYSTSLNLHIRTVHYKLPHPPRKKRTKPAKETTSNDL